MFKGLFKNKNKDSPRRRQDAKSNKNVFQRNRTITGAKSDNSASASDSSDLKTPRTRAYHLSVKRKKVSVIFLTIIGLSVLLFWLITQLTAKVSVAFSDVLSNAVEPSQYSNVIEGYLDANPLERLRFALDEQKLLSYVGNSYPEVRSIDNINMVSMGEFKFALSMRKPVASWAIDGKSYFVDEQGAAFEKDYFKVGVVAIVDESGIGFKDGSVVASNRFLSFVGKVVAASRENEYSVIQALIPNGTTRQLEVKLEGVEPLIRLSIDRSAGEQVEDMVRAVEFLKSKGRSIEYIDVRVENKAFYK